MDIDIEFDFDFDFDFDIDIDTDIDKYINMCVDKYINICFDTIIDNDIDIDNFNNDASTVNYVHAFSSNVPELKFVGLSIFLIRCGSHII